MVGFIGGLLLVSSGRIQRLVETIENFFPFVLAVVVCRDRATGHRKLDHGLQ